MTPATEGENIEPPVVAANLADTRVLGSVDRLSASPSLVRNGTLTRAGRKRRQSLTVGALFVAAASALQISQWMGLSK